MDPKATESRPEPERLLAVQVTATDDGGVQVVIHTQAADGTYYEGVLVTSEQYVADMLRRQVVAAIPERPRIPADLAEVQRRMAHIFG